MDAKKEEFNKTLAKTIDPSQIREKLLDNEYLSDINFVLKNDENFYGEIF